MTNDFYPPMMPAGGVATWDDVLRLARVEPVVRAALVIADLQDSSREEALIAAIFGLYEAKRNLFNAHVQLVESLPTKVVLP